MPQSQPTSLLSLPDELLVRIFDQLVMRWRRKGFHPLSPATLVCRRIRNIAQPILYREVTLSPYSDATPDFEGAIVANPSLGQLVNTLTICGDGCEPDCDEEAIHNSELVRATISAVSKLKELILSEMTTKEAAAILAALPSASLRSLDMQFRRTPASFQWSALWAHVARFSELLMLTCQAWRPDPETEIAPVATAHPGQRVLLPQLVELQVTDFILIQALGAAVLLRQSLPKLRELQITISRSEDSSAVKSILSEAPSTLTTLKLLSDDDMRDDPRRYLPALPALRHLRHLDLGPGTFIEAELLLFLPMAPLESITFYLYALVTDRILQALTGPARPPHLRRICLDHVSGASPAEIRYGFEIYLAEGDPLERLRGVLSPYWPHGGTEQGLRHALAAANANGLEVTGSALACPDWDATFDKVLSDFMMEQAHKTDDHGDVIAKFGEEVATAWLEEHAPDKIPLLREHTSALRA